MGAEKGPGRAQGSREDTTRRTHHQYRRYSMNSLVLYENNPFDLIERFFDDDWMMPRFRSPAIDVYEEGDKYVLEAELPGLTDKDIKLEVHQGQLVLSTAKKEQKEESRKGRWLRRERREFRFARSFTLPEDVDVSRIEAKFRNGVLEVQLPKKPEAAPRAIEVKIN